MTVALVHSRVGGEEVQVVTAFGIPDRSTLGTGKDNGERMIVMGRILLFRLNSLHGRGCVVEERAVSSHGELWGMEVGEIGGDRDLRREDDDDDEKEDEEEDEEEEP